MKLLEYEAKQVLKKYGLPTPRSEVIKVGSLPFIPPPLVLKSQVPTGGRGKAGGVVIVETEDELAARIEELFHLPIKGFLPKTLLAEEKIAIKQEYYLAFLIDRSTSTIRLLAHKQGGINIEDNIDGLFDKAIDGSHLSEVSRRLATFLGYDLPLIEPFIQKLFAAFVGEDATLLEINPLIATDENMLVCGDCKLELDDAARFRHPLWSFEASLQDANFVTLDTNGTIATIANGAGLAMATVDAVAANDMIPANFLDIGGGATTASVLAAFKKIYEFPNIQAIVINIFAGITRCDQIAQAIIEARKQLSSLPPIFIRLAGTNFEEAVALLAADDIPTLGTLEDCLLAAKAVIHE